MALATTSIPSTTFHGRNDHDMVHNEEIVQLGKTVPAPFEPSLSLAELRAEAAKLFGLNPDERPRLLPLSHPDVE